MTQWNARNVTTPPAPPPAKPPMSSARLIITPLILLVVGYLFFGVIGAGWGLLIGLLWFAVNLRNA